MRCGNHSVLIPEGVERDSGHVRLAHGTVYSVRMGNHDHSRRCDATVRIDGKEMGTFRLERGQSMTLERPCGDQGRFTFYLLDSPESQAAELAGVAKSDLGLVSVTFRPEVYTPVYVPPPISAAGPPRPYSPPFMRSASKGHASDATTYSGDRADCAEEKTSGCFNFSERAGGTGLSGQSGQTFYNVGPLNYDPALETVINLRLVEGVVGPRPLKSQPARSTPVPDPIS